MPPARYGPTTSYADRLRGALMLDSRTYREVEQDTDANGQAALTVILAALAAGIGAILSRELVQNALGIAISSVLQWIIFSFAAYFVGTALFSTAETSVTPGQVLRTIGFAQAPNLFLILAVIPVLGGSSAWRYSSGSFWPRSPPCGKPSNSTPHARLARAWWHSSPSSP